MIAELLERLFDTQPIRMGEANGVVKYRVGYGATDAEQILSIISTMSTGLILSYVVILQDCFMGVGMMIVPANFAQ